jgi:hypothetical protein
MQVALDIGTINIQNQEVAKFIQNKSIDEIKNMFTDFLNNQVKIISKKPIRKKGNTIKPSSTSKQKELPSGFLNPITINSYSDIVTRDEIYER